MSEQAAAESRAAAAASPPPPVSPTPDRPTPARHREVLAFCAFALLAAPLLMVLPEGKVGVRPLFVPAASPGPAVAEPLVVLPPTCLSHELFGIDCPGCGLTRSFVYTAAGDLRSAFGVHRVGPLLMAVALLQIPYRANALWGTRRVLPAPVGRAVAALLIAALLGNWCLGLLGA